MGVEGVGEGSGEGVVFNGMLMFSLKEARSGALSAAAYADDGIRPLAASVSLAVMRCNTCRGSGVGWGWYMVTCNIPNQYWTSIAALLRGDHEGSKNIVN